MKLLRNEIFAVANAGKFNFTSNAVRYFIIHKMNDFTFAARQIFQSTFMINLSPLRTLSLWIFLCVSIVLFLTKFALTGKSLLQSQIASQR